MSDEKDIYDLTIGRRRSCWIICRFMREFAKRNENH